LEESQHILDNYNERFKQAYHKGMRAKLGLMEENNPNDDEKLFEVGRLDIAIF